jgi:hypothetical protein
MHGGVAMKQSSYTILAIVGIYTAFAMIYYTSQMSTLDLLQKRVHTLQERENERQSFFRQYAVDASGYWHKISGRGE